RRWRGPTDLHGDLQLGAFLEHSPGSGGHDPEDDLLPAAPVRKPARERRDRTNHGPTAESVDRAYRDGRDFLHRRLCRIDPNRTSPGPRDGPRRARPLPDPPDVRLEYPGDPRRRRLGEREHVLPPVLAAPRVASRRPRLVDWCLSGGYGLSGPERSDSTYDAGRRARLLLLERERSAGLAPSSVQPEFLRRLLARARVLAGLRAPPRLPRRLHLPFRHVREALDHGDEPWPGGPRGAN